MVKTNRPGFSERPSLSLHGLPPFSPYVAPADTVHLPVGMETMAQLEQNLAIAESFTPMTDAERLAFFQDIIPLVQPKNMRWKATDWENPTEWIHRGRGLRQR